MLWIGRWCSTGGRWCGILSSCPGDPNNTRTKPCLDLRWGAVPCCVCCDVWQHACRVSWCKLATRTRSTRGFTLTRAPQGVWVECMVLTCRTIANVDADFMTI